MMPRDYHPKKKPADAASKATILIAVVIVVCFVAAFLCMPLTDSPRVDIIPTTGRVVPESAIVGGIKFAAQHPEVETKELNLPVEEPVKLSALGMPIGEYEAWKPFENHHSSVPFEQLDCPEFPAPGYPKAYNMLKIIENWNPDSTDIPPRHFDSLCHFDHENATQNKYIYNYRNAEVPFVVYNMPEVTEVVKKWSDPNYLRKLLGKTRYRAETSDSNHFMFWTRGSNQFMKSAEGKKWKAPTGSTEITFNDWLDFATKNHNKSIDTRQHEYFRVSSNTKSELMFKELPFFMPKKSLFIVDPGGQRGIHCRFGMRSVIAEAHFDSGRNAIVLFGGMRRYILTHPDQCKDMHMLAKKHPSGRHSDVDWSKPDIEKFPNFAKVVGNEVIMTPGNFLYLPQDWIHFIISLNVNYQCNTRSGFSDKYHHHIRECGF